jgi:hypothetical protein
MPKTTETPKSNRTTRRAVASSKPRKPRAAKPATAKPAPVTVAAKPAIEPKTDKAAERKAFAERIATERATAASVFAQASDAVSVPVKSLAAFKRSYKRGVTAHAIGRKPSVRQAAALAVAIAATGKPATDGLQFSRKFDMRGAAYAIENGCLSDCIASGLATYNAKTETVTLRNAAELHSQIGSIGIKF